MPSTETVYRVFISSPSDLIEERDRLKEEIESIKLPNGSFRVIKWEDDLPSVRTSDAQSEINKLLVNCDILCGIFKSRFGSATQRYDSGTVEEIESSINSNKPVILYFLDQNFSTNKSTYDQLLELLKIEDFKNKYKKKGIYHTCKDIDEVIKKYLRMDLEANIKRICSQSFSAPTNLSLNPPDEEPHPQSGLWYEDSISIFINKYLKKKNLHYNYIEDLTFYENLLFAYDNSYINFLPSTTKGIMEEARIDAFNTKYGNYNYNNDLRAKFPNWATPIYQIIETAFPRKRKLSVLNVGGNYGLELTQIFSDSKYKIEHTIIDISNDAIQRGKTSYPNINFIQSDMESSYLDGNSLFDICFCLRAIESRGVFRNAALIQMSKHIRTGGLIFISIPNGYINEKGEIERGLYDHRTRSFLKDRPISLAKKIFVKLGDYNFTNICIKSLETEILVYAEKGATHND